ncbi:MAG: hypothetical protein HQM09_15020 [Candidatus Riflebacteria bacterium]|nr:hypothetical protein [Candidatus Riflebacteria bacterium]
MKRQIVKKAHNSSTQQIEQMIETALSPGNFISYSAGSSFISELDRVEKHLNKIIPTDPGLAVTFFETFLAGCFEKIEEIDDSSGGFGMFVDSLFAGWVKARQAASSDPDETVTRLLTWGDNDPYCLCHNLEKNSIPHLNKAGLVAMEKQARACLKSANKAKYEYRKWSEVLRLLYIQQQSVDGYLVIAEETGLTDQDCHAIATMLADRRKYKDALSWVERGIALSEKTGFPVKHDLKSLRWDLLSKLGRDSEALDAVWAAYVKDPDKYSYRDLMNYVPKSDRNEWHIKAIQAATNTNLRTLIELMIEMKEVDRLAELLRSQKIADLESITHFVLEPAAKALEKNFPDVAARLWCAQGLRILTSKKSKYYNAAISNFEHGRRCFAVAGSSTEWEAVVEKVRAEHRRKLGFMSDFEKVVAGGGPSKRPSFLERARTRWGQR